MDLAELEHRLGQMHPNHRFQDTDGTYLHMWVPFSYPSNLDFLPQFHVILTLHENTLNLTVYTYHGKKAVEISIEDHQSPEHADKLQEVLSSVSSHDLTLCQGLVEMEGVSSDSFYQDRLGETLVTRSVNCTYLVQRNSSPDEAGHICNECICALNCVEAEVEIKTEENAFLEEDPFNDHQIDVKSELNVNDSTSQDYEDLEDSPLVIRKRGPRGPYKKTREKYALLGQAVPERKPKSAERVVIKRGPRGPYRKRQPILDTDMKIQSDLKVEIPSSNHENSPANIDDSDMVMPRISQEYLHDAPNEKCPNNTSDILNSNEVLSSARKSYYRKGYIPSGASPRGPYRSTRIKLGLPEPEPKRKRKRPLPVPKPEPSEPKVRLKLGEAMGKEGTVKASDGRRYRYGAAPNNCEICQRYFKVPHWRHSICLQPHKALLSTLAKDKIEIPVACPVCREGNIHKMDLNDHFNKCHADLNSNCCVECFEVVKMEKGDELRKHILKNHQSSSHVQIQCSDCGKHFNGRSAMKTHRLKDHLKQFDFVCETCGCEFVRAGQLAAHVRTRHGSKVRCHICQEILQQDTVENHLLKHASFKPYSCSMCSFAYYRRTHVKQHIQKTCKEAQFLTDQTILAEMKAWTAEEKKKVIPDVVPSSPVKHARPRKMGAPRSSSYSAPAIKQDLETTASET